MRFTISKKEYFIKKLILLKNMRRANYLSGVLFIIFALILLIIIGCKESLVNKESHFKTPESTIITLETEAVNGNAELYLNRSYFSQKFVEKVIKGGGTIEEFKQEALLGVRQINEGIRANYKNTPLPVDVIITNKTIIDDTHVVLQYEINYPPIHGVPQKREDTSYLIKLENEWYLDIGAEFDAIEKDGRYLLY